MLPSTRRHGQPRLQPTTSTQETLFGRCNAEDQVESPSANRKRAKMKEVMLQKEGGQNEDEDKEQ